ncbi:Helix-loop-helix protein 6 [Bulinus truncatus]|nr:Helix-loop-helix protein 6 [Bulinus truncatus]
MEFNAEDKVDHSRCRKDCSEQSGEHEDVAHLDPYSPFCLVPLPGQWTGTNQITRRNEKERDRVRYVNESYERLKEHLPIENMNKRISRVDVALVPLAQNNLLSHLKRDFGAVGGAFSKSRTSVPCGDKVEDQCTLWGQSRGPVYPVGTKSRTSVPCGDKVEDQCTLWGQSRGPVYPVGTKSRTSVPCGDKVEDQCTLWGQSRGPVYPVGTKSRTSVPCGEILPQS